MQTLWLAIFVYSIGLAAVLHFRPALMFNENGNWKEFGYHRDSRHTLFPVWLFAIVWAFVSYALASVGVTLWSSAAVAAASSSWMTSTDADEEDASPVEESEVEVDEEIVPVSRTRSRRTTTATKKKPRSGYYVLDPEQADDSAGLRRYIYYGPERPPAESA